ncbi:MAG: DedA family protein [Acidobacteria bacterium]|nr:DedA family protein [Acidobacteriota bacterium]
MNLGKFPHWLQGIIASTGGLGLFLVAFLDSSVLSFPVINDLLVISLSIQSPARMPYYALMATLGSVAGCVLLYFLARKGGEAMFHRHAGERALHIKAWIDRNGFLGMLVAALLPPPTPFKIFVIAAGVFEVPVRSFSVALLIARTVRYFGVGLLAVRYGPAATHYLVEHKLKTSLLALAIVLAGYLLLRFLWRHLHRKA